MGYDTHFDGQIDIVPPLNLKEHNELKKFSETRHEEEDGTPGYWCQWVPTDDGDALVWDEDEKFYNAEEWMKYIIDNFLGDVWCDFHDVTPNLNNVRRNFYIVCEHNTLSNKSQGLNSII